MTITEKEKIKIAKREYARRWRERNKEKVNKYHEKWRQNNQDKVKEYQERHWLKKYEEMTK